MAKRKKLRSVRAVQPKIPKRVLESPAKLKLKSVRAVRKKTRAFITNPKHKKPLKTKRSSTRKTLADTLRMRRAASGAGRQFSFKRGAKSIDL